VRANTGAVKNRLPLILSATALVVALLGATPLGEAARNAVPLALFARNSAKVSGIKASRTPKANQLLPLGANGKFPDSVVPTGPRGPQGERGPAGPAGTQLYAVVNPNGTFYRESSGITAVQRISDGVYQLTFNRSVDECAIVANAGGHRTGDTTWTDVQKAMTTVRTFGAVAEVRTLTDNGFSGGFQERDFGFHVAAFCPAS
jgi:hypothetical protein